MAAVSIICRSMAVLALSAVSVGALAQQTQAPASSYEPAEWQAGKDVVWVPSEEAVVAKMLDLAKITPDDHLIDLGSGDGRTVIAAAKRGARALGIEYDANLVDFSKKRAEQEGVASRATFVKQDLFETDLSQATVITLFLLPEINLKLRPKLLDLKPGTRIVSNTFTMGDWEADETAKLDRDSGCDDTWCTALLWIVPARVAGRHRLPQGELTLRQNYQMLSGTLRTRGKTIPVTGKVLGDDVILTADGRELRGRMNDKQLILL